MDPVRSFLRYGQLVVELTDRPLVLGRSSTCDVVVDDELASREHCRIAVEGERVVLTDLASKNGVLVNGQGASGTVELHHGDTITIGTQQLVLVRQRRAPRTTPVTGRMRAASEGDDREPTTQGDIFTILHGSALAALERGHVTDAEPTARNLFVAMRATLARGRALPEGVLASAVELGLVLADRTGEVRWLEQVLELLIAARQPLPESGASRFAELARRVGKPARALAEYLRTAEDVGGAESSIHVLRRL